VVLVAQFVESESWESGSADDPIRNTLVIPMVAEIFENLRPSSILDFGAGTGYVSRKVKERLSFPTVWTLLDQDEDRLNIAVREGHSDNAEIICEDFRNASIAIQSFDAILVSFTLLETGISQDVADWFAARCRPSGTVVIVLPDVLPDVFLADADSPGTASKFFSGEVSIPKIDKFTKTEYPFQAFRTESVLEFFLKRSFFLERFDRGQVDEKSFFVFAFRRRCDDNEHPVN
jgi:SAM-dependent methyltransferase